MRLLYRHRKTIFLVLVLSLVENITSAYFFDTLSHVCADYRHKLEFTAIEPIKPSKPVSSSNVRIVEGPNGTKNVYVECLASVNLEVRASGEYFDYSAYVRHVMLWKTLENIFNLVRDIHKMLFETTVCMFCVFSLGFGLKKVSASP